MAKVHKQERFVNQSSDAVRMVIVCKHDPIPALSVRSSKTWIDVTCKNCLKHKPEVKR